jgi:hypothetical protein
MLTTSVASRRGVDNIPGLSGQLDRNTQVEKDLAFGIMRSHFHHGYPKGTHCCVACTLAAYTVLEVGAIRYFDCAKLSEDVRRLVLEGRWRFAKPANPRMVSWAIRDDTSSPASAR